MRRAVARLGYRPLLLPQFICPCAQAAAVGTGGAGMG